ncbi:MAG: NifU family protein [Microthrixaceae bacterium]|nr:NifU family protein [Microthrixaceae bacterium]
MTSELTENPTDGATVPVLEISPVAMETVLGLLADEGDPESLGLRIEITGTRGVDFVYDLSFDELSEASGDDLVCDLGGISVIVPGSSVEQLRGSVLDVPRNPTQGGLVIRNPNRPDPLAGVELHLEGTVAERVQQLIDQQINPSLASHGGFATLVGVEDDERVFITLGGGCQGCAMSRMTITQGIDRAIRDAIPEVTEIIDATDHSAGESPFY